MPDLLTRVARKWADRYNRYTDTEPQLLLAEAILAACREVLEEVNKEWVNRLSVYNADKAIPLEGIAAALLALREEKP